MYIFGFINKFWRFLNTGPLTLLLWALGLNIMFGIAFYFSERGVQDGLTLIDSLWWAMVTMTTVGYGDYYAQTPVGRFLISYPCMILGIGIIGYLVGMVANYMIEWTSKKRKGEMDIAYSNHIIICNYPGEDKLLTVINELRATQEYATARFVLITETLDELPEKLVKHKVHFVRGYPTDEEVLFRANVLECAGVIVLAENPTDFRSDDRTFTIGSIIEMIEKERNVPIKTITELVGNRGVRNMERAMVDGIVSGEGLTGCLLAQEFINPGVHNVIAQIISNTVGSQIYIHTTQLVGHRIIELQTGVLQHEANIQVIGIIKRREQVLNPSKQTIIEKGDRLIVLAENLHDLGAIEREILQQTA